MQVNTIYDEKIYCSIFKDKDNFKKCMIPEYYCSYICNEEIPTIENILNFNCFKECIKKLHNEDIELSKLAKGIYIPKVHDKVDFQANGDAYFRPATIMTIKKGNDRQYEVALNYLNESGDSESAVVQFPSDRLFKCAEKLTRRIDCLVGNN